MAVFSLNNNTSGSIPRTHDNSSRISVRPSSETKMPLGQLRGHDLGDQRSTRQPSRADDGAARHEPSTIVHRHNEREDTHAYNATIPSPQDSKTAPQGDLDTPGATQIVHHDREDTYERSVAVPDALDVYNESKAIERRDDTQATTYASNATQESNPAAPGDEATPDNAPTQLDASDVFSSHRIAKLRDPEPTTLDNAGPDPFRVGEGDIRRKSTSRDGAFDEGETACQGVEPNRSQQPVDEDVASIGRNGDKATKLDVPSRLEPPARSAEAGEASEAFERQNNASSPPIRAPEVPEPSQVWQTMPNPPDRPLPTVHAPEPGDDPPGVIYDAIDTPTPFLAMHKARHAPQSTPERVHAIPSMRACTPTVFDDGGEVCLRHDFIEDLATLEGRRIVSSARNGGEEARSNLPGCSTSPTHPPKAIEPFEADPASPEPMSNTPGDRIAPSTHPKGADGASKRTRHARMHADNDSQLPCMPSPLCSIVKHVSWFYLPVSAMLTCASVPRHLDYAVSPSTISRPQRPPSPNYVRI
ncbi:hypothetical protein BDV93DRAFT_516245 [Ceratobasidium sp. AG-I]|nr:hypothetical protein BDV93DRAFT_516245 [Ceratobasidium sp. AG-I]